MTRLRVLTRLEIVDEERIDDGWLKIRRCDLRNHYEDGGRSEIYRADTAHRIGVDAVAVVPWRRAEVGIEVLLRTCLRPGIDLRARLDPPVADPHHPLPMIWEICAGIPESDERGPDGLRRCGARELLEEMGLEVPPESLVDLGGPIYPSAGILAEMIHLYAAAVPPGTEPGRIAGDGTPFEEAGHLRWWDLDDALAACRSGQLADAKTEIVLWRLFAHCS